MLMPRHKWDHDNERRIAACASQDGNARNARPCKNCGMIKVTVLPAQGFPWHEWHTRDGDTWIGEATPPCIVVPAAVKKLFREVA